MNKKVGHKELAEAKDKPVAKSQKNYEDPPETEMHKKAAEQKK